MGFDRPEMLKRWQLVLICTIWQWITANACSGQIGLHGGCSEIHVRGCEPVKQSESGRHGRKLAFKTVGRMLPEGMELYVLSNELKLNGASVLFLH